MIHICGNCGRELEAEVNPFHPGTNDPVTIVEPCTCLRDEKVAWIGEDLTAARNTIIEALDELRRNL